jgi:prepilin-type N-terminal cleavage/methylation domain-containing protein
MSRESHITNHSFRTARGFTAIEVLIAMTIMFIGTAAVMTMQKTSIQGNLDARKADVASSIARTWVERIRHESMRWTQPSASQATSNLSNVPGLNNHLDGKWFRPTDDMIAGQGANPGTVETMSYAFDILGRDLAQADITSTNVQFVAEARITPLLSQATSDGGTLGLLYRIDVRVVWPRGIQTVPNAATAGILATDGWSFTSAATIFVDPAGLGGVDYTLFHAINVTTAITESAAE